MNSDLDNLTFPIECCDSNVKLDSTNDSDDDLEEMNNEVLRISKFLTFFSKIEFNNKSMVIFEKNIQ